MSPPYTTRIEQSKSLPIICRRKGCLMKLFLKELGLLERLMLLRLLSSYPCTGSASRAVHNAEYKLRYILSMLHNAERAQVT